MKTCIVCLKKTDKVAKYLHSKIDKKLSGPCCKECWKIMKKYIEEKL